VYSGEYDVCDVTLSVYPHRASLKNMPGHGGVYTIRESNFYIHAFSLYRAVPRRDNGGGGVYLCSLP
jgi:hypothetical protein